MRSVVVNGSRAIQIPMQQQAQIAEMVYDRHMTPEQKHEKLCLTLRVGRFVPACGHKPYALRATIIELYDEHRPVMRLGGWFECAYCHINIDQKPAGANCPQCNANSIKNFMVNQEAATKKKKWP